MVAHVVIKLLQGSLSNEYHQISESLDIFMKGSKTKKDLLKTEKPDLYSQFSVIWDIRN